MMKLALLALAASVALVQAENKPVYPDVDVKELFGNVAERNNFFDCMLGKPCVNQDFKRMTEEVILTSCAKCTDVQKLAYKEAIEIMRTEYPEILKQIRERLNIHRE